MPLRYTGAGFLLIQRSVFERMKQDKTIDEYRSDYSGRVEHDFWRPGVYKGRYLPEDFFFVSARATSALKCGPIRA